MKKSIPILVFLMVSTFIIGCGREKPVHFKLTVTKHIYFESLSSASGVLASNEIIRLVGDDIPWLVGIDGQLTYKHLADLSGIDSIVNGRTPYSLKSDYECMELINYKDTNFILVLSSGSKTPSRDTAVLVRSSDDSIVSKRSIRALFDAIRQKAGMGDEQINIEGLAATDNIVFLFHRGNISGNFITALDKNAFMDYVTSGDNNVPDPLIYTFDLPEYQQVKSGFSGACYFKGLNSLLFTASMENTQTVTADGEVLGSYVGIIPLETIEKGNYYAELLKEGATVLPKKLEGISILKENGNELGLITVCDNDNGSSDIFFLTMHLEK